jgi:hypothetical protein
MLNVMVFIKQIDPVSKTHGKECPDRKENTSVLKTSCQKKTRNDRMVKQRRIFANTFMERFMFVMTGSRRPGAQNTLRICENIGNTFGFHFTQKT